jgi:hypothetical protein
MSRTAAHSAVARARELTRGMMQVAERGDIQGVLELDALRSRLLHEFLDHASVLAESEREALNEISQANDAVIRKLETMRAGTQRKLETVGRGKRALAAYSSVQRGGS